MKPTFLIPLIFFFPFLNSCENKKEDIQMVMDEKDLSQDKAEDVILVYSENAKIVARLFAKQFIRHEDKKKSYIDIKGGLKVEFFDDSLQISNTVTAKKARYYESDKNVIVQDSVVVVNKKGETLNTEELIWNQSIKKFYTNKFVRITTPTQVLFGDGLEANEDFSWYQIKNIKGNVQVEKSVVPAAE